MKDLEQELTKAAQALENFAKASSPTKSEGAEMTQAEYESLLETFKTIGKDGLKKSIPKLTAEQLILVQAVLEKATSMDKEAVKQPPAPAKEFASQDVKGREHDEDEDEALVKEENKNIKHQGDDSELPGQVIKSENPDEKADAKLAEKVESLVDKHEEENKDAEKEEDKMKKHVPGVPDKKFDDCVSDVKAKDSGNAYAICTASLKKGEIPDADLQLIINRMKEKKLSKAQIMGALEQYGQSKDKTEKMYDCEKEELKKDESKPADEMKDAPDAEASKKEDKEIKEGLKSDDGLDKKPEEDKKEEPKDAPKPPFIAEAKPEVKKSVSWTNPIAPFHESSARRGRNAHFSVDEMIAKAEEKTSELKKSRWIDSDPYEAEVLKKSDPSKKVSLNDIIEQNLDYDRFQLELAKSRKDWKPTGTFNVKSFDEKDLGIQAPEVLAKASPRGEGSRGGRIIGHTTTGKPIYADPKHPEHQHFNDEDHYDASMAHGEHRRAHESNLNKPINRGSVGKHMDSASSAMFHGKGEKTHLDRVKQKDLTKLHPQIKTMGDMAGHAKKVATSQFDSKEAKQSSTKEAPEQKS